MTDIVEDHGRAKPRAETEEEHAPALIAADRLHEGVVDNLDGLAEMIRKIVADPSAREMGGIPRRFVSLTGPG
jgi:hypothetical protein